MAKRQHHGDYEQRRLTALRKLNILGTSPDADFDALTALAATYFSCEIAIVALVDEDTEWMKSKVGTDLTEIPRKGSFCDYTVTNGEPLIVENAMADKRFRDSPYVTGEPYVRFYAGVPVREIGGYPVGTMCLISPEPRKFSQKDRGVLVKFAQLTESILRNHASETQLTERSNELEKWNTLFSQSERMANLGTWEVNIDEDTLVWSNGVYRIHGLTPDIPISVADAIEFYVPEDRELVEKAVADAITNNTQIKFEARIRAGDGIRHVRSVGEVITDKSGGRKLVGVFQDISEEHHATEQLKTLAFTDSLTGAMNRLGFDREFAEQMASCEASDTYIHLAILDLDSLKAINDVYGHLSGDFAIRKTAQIISERLPKGAQLARLGGDEFAVFGCSNLSPGRFAKTLEKIRRGFDKGLLHSGHYLTIGISGGYATSAPGDKPSNLLSRADAALYHSKRANPGTISKFASAMNEQSHDRNTAVEKLRKAIGDGRVLAHYQPIVRIADGAILACEALMRVHGRNGRLQTAEQYALAFEDAKISRDVGALMVEQTTRDLGRLAKIFDRPPRVSFNVTAADLLALGGVEYFHKMVAENGVDHSQFCIELTESMLLVNDKGAMKSTLAELRKAGTLIALDDFGTGYSSLTHLRDFPIDFIKIDKSFVARLEGEHESRLIVQSLIQMADNLDIMTVAEGIETSGQARLLEQIGCKYGQGYSYGRAEPLEKLIDRIKAANAEQAVGLSRTGIQRRA